MSDRSLLLVDGTAELYRSYYAFKDFHNKKGEPTGAAFGFTQALERLLASERPTHAAAAFDLPAPTFRHAAFAEYKATRKPSPEPMIAQIPVVKEIVKAFSVAVLELPGFEADDIIATLVKRARAAGYPVTIVSQDKDFLQLLQDGVSILHPRKGRLDAAAAEQMLGVPPSRIPDLLALMGDSSDNIPGVDGIGEKGATKLIAEFGTLDSLYQHLDQVGNPNIRMRLESQRERAYMSYSLALMHEEVPIEESLEGLALRRPDGDVLRRIFESLDFTTLAARFKPSPPKQSNLFDQD